MRFWEIDFARGAAVALMVLFNWSFALYYLGLLTSDGNWLFWWLFPRAIASAFIFIAGISLSISYARNKNPVKHLRRGAFIFLTGMAITAATWLYAPQEFIIFGILHLIGLSILLSVPLLNAEKKLVLAAAVAAILAGVYLQSAAFDFPYLVWLGFIPENFTTLDYFPLLPWFGVFLMGTVSGRAHFSGRKSSKNKSKIIPPFTFLGRHSLIIYIIHQPLLLAALYLAGLL